MDHLLPDIDLQIAAFLSGNCSTEEAEALMLWQNQSDENKKTFDLASKAWKNCLYQLSKAEIRNDKELVLRSILSQTTLELNRSKALSKLLRIAAFLAGPVLLAIGLYVGYTTKSNKVVAWNSVSAPRKHIAIFNMADGTEIWLNAGSTLSYPTEIQNNKREVKLVGEGYFKVTKDASKPFIVSTPNTTVRVLGTTFNMKAYPDEEKVTTTLEEGSIELTTTKSGNLPCKLRPGEQAICVVKENKITVNQVDASRFSAWRSEKFLFRDADLKTIITELERLYDIKIHINNPKLATLRFRGMFSYDQDLLDAFETLKRSVTMNYTIKGREVWLE